MSEVRETLLDPQKSDSGTWKWLAALAVSVGLTTGLTSAALSQQAYIPAAPEPGTDIPKSTVRMGILPYADGSFPIIGVKKGFFTDVGIGISPAEGTKVTEEQAHSLLMRGDLDVTHGYPPNFLPTYQNSRSRKADHVP